MQYTTCSSLLPRKIYTQWVLIFSIFAATAAFADDSDATDVGQTIEKCRYSDFKDVKSVSGRIMRVMDGDTVGVSTEGTAYSVRLLSVDTPETRYMGKSQGYWGDVASEFMKELMPIGTRVRVVFDRQKCDRYGRLLGHVWKGDVHANREVVFEGYAVNYCIYPNVAHCEEFSRDAAEAIAGKKKFLGSKNPELPYMWRRRIDERKPDKYVGDIISHNVYKPGQENRVPIENRIFFMTKGEIKSPYVLVP